METAVLHLAFAANVHDFTDFNLTNARNEHHNRRNTMNFNRNRKSESPQPSMHTPFPHNVFAATAPPKHGNNLVFRYNQLLFRHFDNLFRHFYVG